MAGQRLRGSCRMARGVSKGGMGGDDVFVGLGFERGLGQGHG